MGTLRVPLPALPPGAAVLLAARRRAWSSPSARRVGALVPLGETGRRRRSSRGSWPAGRSRCAATTRAGSRRWCGRATTGSRSAGTASPTAALSSASASPGDLGGAHLPRRGQRVGRVRRCRAPGRRAIDPTALQWAAGIGLRYRDPVRAAAARRRRRGCRIGWLDGTDAFPAVPFTAWPDGALAPRADRGGAPVARGGVLVRGRSRACCAGRRAGCSSARSPLAGLALSRRRPPRHRAVRARRRSRPRWCGVLGRRDRGPARAERDRGAPARRDRAARPRGLRSRRPPRARRRAGPRSSSDVTALRSRHGGRRGRARRALACSSRRRRTAGRRSRARSRRRTRTPERPASRDAEAAAPARAAAGPFTSRASTCAAADVWWVDASGATRVEAAGHRRRRRGTLGPRRARAEVRLAGRAARAGRLARLARPRRGASPATPCASRCCASRRAGRRSRRSARATSRRGAGRAAVTRLGIVARAGARARAGRAGGRGPPRGRLRRVGRRDAHRGAPGGARRGRRRRGGRRRRRGRGAARRAPAGGRVRRGARAARPGAPRGDGAARAR